MASTEELMKKYGWTRTEAEDFGYSMAQGKSATPYASKQSPTGSKTVRVPEVAPKSAYDQSIEGITGNVKPFVGATPDYVEDTYFDVMLKDIDNIAAQKTKAAKGQYNLFVEHLKKDRQLFQKDLERNYARTLQRQNEQAYSRGMGNSGNRIDQFKTTKEDRDFSDEANDLNLLKQQDVSREAYEQRIKDIQTEAAQAKKSIKSPYASYSYR